MFGDFLIRDATLLFSLLHVNIDCGSSVILVYCANVVTTNVILSQN